MEALVMMLHNTKTNMFHPIMYMEKLFPGGFETDGNKNIVRYKSKGHRTNGFTDRQQAIDSIKPEIQDKLTEQGWNVNMELEGDLEWDGEEMPIDIQLRPRPNKTVN